MAADFCSARCIIDNTGSSRKYLQFKGQILPRSKLEVKKRNVRKIVPSENVSARPLNSCSFVNCSVKIEVNYFK